jgi:hypothetical protein
MPRNRELFLKIAEVIEKHPKLYDQTAVSPEPVPVDLCSYGLFPYIEDPLTVECRTPGCIAGWAAALTPVALRQQLALRLESPRWVLRSARVLLGLSLDEASILFGGAWAPSDGRSVPEELRRIADGGEIRGVLSESMLDILGAPFCSVEG